MKKLIYRKSNFKILEIEDNFLGEEKITAIWEGKRVLSNR